jgi:hypothetical protein
MPLEELSGHARTLALALLQRARVDDHTQYDFGRLLVPYVSIGKRLNRRATGYRGAARRRVSLEDVQKYDYAAQLALPRRP